MICSRLLWLTSFLAPTVIHHLPSSHSWGGGQDLSPVFWLQSSCSQLLTKLWLDTVLKSCHPGITLDEFKSQLHHLIAVYPWASSFYNKVGLVPVPTSSGGWLWKLTEVIDTKCLEGSLAYHRHSVGISHYNPASALQPTCFSVLVTVPEEVAGKPGKTDLKKIYPVCWKTNHRSTRSTDSGSVVWSLEIKDRASFELNVQRAPIPC